MRRSHAVAIGLALALFAACAGPPAPASTPAAPVAAPASPPVQDRGLEDLTTRVLHRFTSGAAAAFDSIYPFERGRGMVAFAASRDLPRVAGFARSLHVDGDHALIALGGHVSFGNSGDETGYAEGFSGVYEAVRTDGEWRLVARVPLDSVARIRSQALDVRLEPGVGLRVRASLVVDVLRDAGFVARLNHGAMIDSVVVNESRVAHDFGGGLLRVAAPPGRVHVVIDYALDVARDSTTERNSAHFAADYGHVRNQYYWHPRGAGFADFLVRVQAPARLHVATDLPQDDSVAGDVRLVRARSRAPAEALSLVYDATWKPVTRRVGDATLALFTTPDFQPSADSLADAFARIHATLSRRFAPPASHYFVVAQQRARPGRGWLWRSNEMIGAAANGGPLTWAGPPPRASFGHEVAHGWLVSTGPASNFLGEGWAMLAESILIEDALGADAARLFWAHRRNLYWLQANEGRQSLLEDPANAGIAYTKGPWVLRMLRDYIGEESFAEGMRRFMRIEPGQPAGFEEFAAAMSDAARRDVRAFLTPWAEETTLPRVRARIEPGFVVVEQHDPLFVLPLELDLLTASGPIRRTLVLDQRLDSIPTAGLAPVRDVVVDPERRILMHRDRGEVVRFELRAQADSVLLVPDFSREPIPAVREGEVWSVTAPLSAGIYLYDWRVDGVDRDGGVREVRPLEPLAESWPR